MSWSRFQTHVLGNVSRLKQQCVNQVSRVSSDDLVIVRNSVCLHLCLSLSGQKFGKRTRYPLRYHRNSNALTEEVESDIYEYVVGSINLIISKALSPCKVNTTLYFIRSSIFFIYGEIEATIFKFKQNIPYMFIFSIESQN